MTRISLILAGALVLFLTMAPVVRADEKVDAVLAAAAKLESEDPEVRVAGIAELVEAGWYARAVMSRVARAVHDEDERVRQAALTMLYAWSGQEPSSTREAVEPIIELLPHADAWTNVYALGVLNNMGHVSERYDAVLIPKLIGLLDPANTEQLGLAAELLSWMPERTPQAAPRLRELSKHASPHVRRRIIEALRLYSARDHADVFLAASRDRDSWLARVATEAMGDTGLPVRPEVSARLLALASRAARFEMQDAALSALGTLRSPKTFPHIAALTNHESPKVRIAAMKSLASANAPGALQVLMARGREATQALAELGVDAQPAVPSLVRALEGENPAEATAAAVALRRMGIAARPALPALVAALTRGPLNSDEASRLASRPVSEGAATTLSWLTAVGVSPEEEHGPALVRAASRATDHNLNALLGVLAAQRPLPKGVVSIFERALDLSTPTYYRRERIEAAGKLGTHGAPLLNQLRQIAKEEPWWRLDAEAAIAMVAIAPEEVERSVAFVATAVEDLQTRGWALRHLSDVGLRAAAAIPVVRPHLRASDPLDRERVAVTLLHIDATLPKDAVAVLKSRLKEPDAGWSISRVGALGSRGASLHPLIVPSLKDASPWVRTSAAMALGRLGAATEPILSALRTARRDPEAEVRTAAAWALDALRPGK